MGHRIGCVQAPAGETQGVNDRWQLAMAELELRAWTNRHWLLHGVTMLDPWETFIDVTVKIGRDVTIYPGTMLQGFRPSSVMIASRSTPSSSTAASGPAPPSSTRSTRFRGRPRRDRRSVCPSSCGFLDP